MRRLEEDSPNANRSSIKRDGVTNSMNEAMEAIERLRNPEHVGKVEPTVPQPTIPETPPPA